jgi:hypothetical protein
MTSAATKSISLPAATAAAISLLGAILLGLLLALPAQI